MSQSLVLQSEHEKMLEKLQNMQLNNLTARQQEMLEFSKSKFFRLFKELSYSFFGLSDNQLKEFNANELKVLDKLISRKARPWAICQMIFTFGVPVFGWIIGMEGIDEVGYRSWSYLRHRKYLQKAYGENLFLLETLKQMLQPGS